jgi:hypothetical protein
VPVGAAALLAVAGSQGTIFNYPLALQRALTFLPGDWDAKASSEASGSSKWRDKMKDLFFKDYFHKSPIFGTGYHFDPNLAKTDTDVYLAIAKRQAAAGDEFADVRHFIEQKMPHEGPIHILLVTGSVGAAFFVAFCAAMLLYAFGTVLRTPTGQVTSVQVWALAVLFPQILGFFVVFGDLTIFLAQVCPVIIILERYNRLQALAAAPQALETSAPDHPPLVLGKPLAPWQPRQGPVS